MQQLCSISINAIVQYRPTEYAVISCMHTSLSIIVYRIQSEHSRTQSRSPWKLFAVRLIKLFVRSAHSLIQYGGYISWQSCRQKSKSSARNWMMSADTLNNMHMKNYCFRNCTTTESTAMHGVQALLREHDSGRWAKQIKIIVQHAKLTALTSQQNLL